MQIYAGIVCDKMSILRFTLRRLGVAELGQGNKKGKKALDGLKAQLERNDF